MKGKRKLKIDYKGNKYYLLNQSPLYGLSNLKDLSILLCTPLSEIHKLRNNNDCFYNVFINKDGREIQEPINLMYLIHNKLASLFSRIHTPSYLHSFKKKHSYITNSKAHLSSNQVITFDIKSFYQSISQNTIRLFFKNNLKCSPDIAYLLSKICSYNNHVPTGSQASIDLIFLANQTMFDEMNALANKLNLCMTVYVDDITISGDKVDMSTLNTMEKILKKYGYRVNKKKTCRYLGGQTPIVTGVALHDGKISQTNIKYKGLRKKSSSLLSFAENLDLDLIKKEYDSLEGNINNLYQLDSLVPKETLEAKDKLGKLLGNRSN